LGGEESDKTFGGAATGFGDCLCPLTVSIGDVGEGALEVNKYRWWNITSNALNSPLPEL
jgi:hypothetical protein